MLIFVPVYYHPPPPLPQSHFIVLSCVVHFLSFCCAISYTVVFPSNVALYVDELTVVRSASLNYCTCNVYVLLIYIYIYMHIYICHIGYNMPYFLKYCACFVIALLKQQCVVVRTVHCSEIPTSLDRWVTNTPSDKMLCPQENCLSLYFHKNITCLSVSLLRIGQVFSVFCKTLYQWVMTCCCFMSDVIFWPR